ncbi:MAG: alpha/beta hydrolase [Magnetovibrio sp.]|nr:alpha/beta hydrolase [Magnetovibrio sp.]
MRQRHLTVDGPGAQKGRRIGYTEWGDAANPRVLVCAHGLTRVGRDFDALAEALAADYRIVCPDAAGRGASDWLIEAEHYGYPLYISDTTALLAEIGAAETDWVGTSMGGFLGMMLAAAEASPIRRLVVNDIGPFLPQAALLRISEYLSTGARFADVAEMEAHLRIIHAPFGPLTDAQWRHMAEHSVRTAPDGGDALHYHYDPAIAEAFNQVTGGDIAVWGMWDAIRCPVLALRGENSDVLPAETAYEMTQRGPKARLVEFAETGHAPALMDAGQIALVRDWLRGE